MVANNLITNYDILTQGDFLDCTAYAFINKWWDKETPKWPEFYYFEELKADIRQEKPQYFNLAEFKCRRYKDHLLTSIRTEGIEWIRKSTIYFKEDGMFYWVNNIQRVNDGRLIIGLEIDWIAQDWGLLSDIVGLWVFDTKRLSLEQIKEIKESCFLCPQNSSGDEYVIPSIPNNHHEYKQEETGFKIEGQYTIIHMVNGNSRYTNSAFNRAWNAEHWIEPSLTEANTNTIASFVMPRGVEAGQRPYDENTGVSHNFITQRYLNLDFNTEHFLKHHGRYLVKSLGEELGEVKGINCNNLGNDSYFNDNVAILFFVGAYNWEMEIIVRNSVFSRNFFIKEARQSQTQTTNWLDIIAKTIIAGISIAGAGAVAVGSGGTAAIPAGAMAVGTSIQAGKAWKGAFNKVHESVCVDEITTFYHSKVFFPLVEIIPQIPWNYYQEYYYKVNWHVQNDYFPLNDEITQLTPGIGTFSGRGIEIFGNLNGWTKLSSKCVIDAHGNKALDFLRNNNVFIYNKEPLAHNFLAMGSAYERPFDFRHVTISGNNTWTTTSTINERQLIQRQPVYVWTNFSHNGVNGRLHNGTTQTFRGGDMDLGYPRWDRGERVFMHGGPNDEFIFTPTPGGGQEMQQWRNTTRTITHTHTSPTLSNVPLNNLPRPQALGGINPFDKWGGNPPTSSLGKGGTPPPPPNLGVRQPTMAPTEAFPGVLQPNTLSNLTQIPSRDETRQINKNSLGIDKLREQMQQRQQERLSQQQRIRQPLQRMGHTIAEPPAGQQVYDTEPFEKEKPRAEKQKPKKKITE